MGHPNDDAAYGFLDVSDYEALRFLERSRDVASEVVVDGTRRETSTSRREEATAIDSGAVVR
jgi:hypothetical protein